MSNEGKDSKKPYDRSFAAALSFWTQIGVTMVGCLFIGVFSGILLDKLFGSSPWMVLIFSLIGMAAAFRSIFRLGK